MPRSIKLNHADVVAGIDVGGAKKGFHAVALSDRAIVGKISSTDARAIVEWCVGVDAKVVGVDAPIAWSTTGRARAGELALMQVGISCFATPSEQVALSHPTDYYGWMRNGLGLYSLLSKRFHTYDGHNMKQRPVMFETFPYAIARSLLGKAAASKSKREARRALLAREKISCELLTNIDFIDAALCALMAGYFSKGKFTQHGDSADGFIITPPQSGS